MPERTDARPQHADAYPPPEPTAKPYRPERLVKPRQPKPYPEGLAPPEPRKAPQDERTTFRVRILPAADGLIRDIGGSARPVQHLLKAGEVLELPIVIATDFVERRGYGEWACRVRSLVNSLSAGDFVLMIGDIAPMAPDRAGVLAAKGLVELVSEDTPSTLPRKEAVTA